MTPQERSDMIVSALFEQVATLGSQLMKLPEPFCRQYIEGNRSFLEGKLDAQAITKMTLTELRQRKRDTKFLSRQLIRLMGIRKDFIKYVKELETEQNGLIQ